MQISFNYGREQLTVDVAAERLVALQRPAPPTPMADPGAAVRDALDAPLRFPPLRRALTPDDHVTVVVDERLPALTEMVTAVLDHIASAGVAPEAVTLLCPPSPSRQDWVSDLPERHESVQTATHSPADRKQLAYLASTRKGRRVYLNRAVVDADQLVVLTGLRFDPLMGHAGAAGAVFPAMSDTETRHAWDKSLSMDAPGNAPWPARGEADEVAWLLGAPFQLQVVEGPGDTVASVVAGSHDVAADGRALLDRLWRGTVGHPVDTVIAGMTGDPARQDLGDMARALACAARVVRPNGTIVLLCQTRPAIGESFQRMMDHDDPERTFRSLAGAPPDDWPTAYSWLQAARRARIVLLSGIPSEAAEGLFTTPLEQARQVQRLIDAGGDCLFLPDAHKLMVTTENDS
jgi:nickel-dependent lactate racemase